MSELRKSVRNRFSGSFFKEALVFDTEAMDRRIKVRNDEKAAIDTESPVLKILGRNQIVFNLILSENRFSCREKSRSQLISLKQRFSCRIRSKIR